MTGEKLTGRIAANPIRMQSTPKPPVGAVERFLALGQCSGAISDPMDELQISNGVIGASVLKSTMPGRVICGPALTMRDIRERTDALAGAKAGVNCMAEFEAHNRAEDGDVLVIQGGANVSNMGGISGRIGKRQGERGAIVLGGVRDISDSRSCDYPIWSSEALPATGKWRLETVEINGEIEIAGVRICPGDLAFADDTGVCFIPRNRILATLERCEKKAQTEVTIVHDEIAGMPFPEIMPLPKAALRT